MATFRVVSEKDAPRPRKVGGRLNQRMVEYESYLSQVGSGKVGVITPGDGDTARGVALRVSRAGKRVGRDVQTWVAEGEVYFKPK